MPVHVFWLSPRFTPPLYLLFSLSLTLLALLFAAVVWVEQVEITVAEELDAVQSAY